MRTLRILTLAVVPALASCGTSAQDDPDTTDAADTSDSGTEDTGSDTTTDVSTSDGSPPDDAAGDAGPAACTTPSPAGCIETGCPDEMECRDTGDCIPSSCFCDPATGTWGCTDDCGGGSCVERGPCEVDSDCVAPQVCDAAACQEVDCPTIFEPVCGADGATYPNACVARVAHVAVEHAGACTDTGCTSDSDCAPGEAICEGDTCVACPSPDACEACPEGYAARERNGCTTCACDPVRECESSADCAVGESCRGIGLCTDLCRDGDPACCSASVCVGEEGPCAGPNPAGCVSTGCPDGLVCDATVGCTPSACGCDPATGSWVCTADCSGGTCVDGEGVPCDEDRDCAIGDVCEGGLCTGWGCIGLYDPVCGADGNTYSNGCYARLAHVEVVSAGECAVPCADTTECDRGEVCNPETQRCEPPCGPIACLIPDPVCGSDGVTYTCGAVEAACNGATVVHDGPCRD